MSGGYQYGVGPGFWSQFVSCFRVQWVSQVPLFEHLKRHISMASCLFWLIKSIKFGSRQNADTNGGTPLILVPFFVKFLSPIDLPCATFSALETPFFAGELPFLFYKIHQNWVAPKCGYQWGHALHFGSIFCYIFESNGSPMCHFFST